MKPTVRIPLLLPILLACAAVLPYLPALGNEFAFDDAPIIVNNAAVTHFNLKDLWTQPYWPAVYHTARIYRPLTVTTFAIDWAFGQGKPWIFVAVNIALHLLVTLLVLRLIRRILPRQPEVAWVTAFLFAVHPIHVEAVVGIVGRSELLAAAFTLLGYLLWLDGERDGRPARSLEACGLWLLALLAKESAVALPAVLFLHRIGRSEPRSTRVFRRVDLAWPAALAVALALRAHALGGLATPVTNLIDNPLAHVGPLQRTLGAGGVLGRQIFQIIFARRFSADYSYAEIHPDAALYRGGVAVLIPLIAAIAWAWRRGRGRTAGWGILFFFLTWLVTSNLLLAIGTCQADRLMYLPVLGLFVAATAIASHLATRLRARRFAAPLAILLIVAYGARAAVRTPQWHDDQTLFEAAVRDAPRSVKARVNLATGLLHDESPETARRALEILDPVAKDGVVFGPYLQQEAKARMFLGQSDPARLMFQDALLKGADSAEVLIELGNIAIEKEEGKEALVCFDLARRTGNLRQHADIGHASALAIMGRYGEAADAWLPLVTALPDSVPVRTACAFNLTKAGRTSEAISLVRAGIERRKDARLYNSLARALLAARDPAALETAQDAVRQDPSIENLATLALVEIASGDTAGARATRSRVTDADLLQEIDDALSQTPRP